MNRIQCLVKVLAFSLILLRLGGVSNAQERPGKPQDGPRISMIDDLWRQMGLLQRQIVGLEVGDTNPRATPRSEPLLRNIARALPDNPPQKKSEGKPDDLQKPVPAPKPVPGPEKPPKLSDNTKDARADQLWRQITELQKAILKLEIAAMNPRLIANATPAANSNGRNETPDTDSTKNPDRISGSGPNRETPQKTIPGQQRPLELEPRGGSNDAQIGQLWQQISQLYKQIVALEVGDARSP